MKKIKNIIAALVLVSALVLTGCVTSTQLDPFGAPVVVKTVDIPRVAAVTKEVTTIGISLALANNADLLPKLQIAVQELDTLAASDTITPELIIAILDQIPIKQFRSPEGVIAFNSAKVVLVAAGWSNVDLVRIEQLRPIVVALRDGLIAGGVTP